MADPTVDPKPGFNTTEFWLVLVLNVVGVLMQTNVIPVDSIVGKIIAGIIQVLTTLGYITSRTVLKK